MTAYRPLELVRVGAFVEVPQLSTFFDFSDDPTVAELLDRWDRFQPIDTAVVSHLRSVDFNAAADSVAFLGASAEQSRVAAMLASVCRWAGRQQDAAIMRMPEFVRLKRRLELLAAEGALVSHDALVRGAAPSAHESPLRIGVLGVVTRDDPVRLHRCLDSFLTKARVDGRRLRVMVCDESSSPSHQEENRAVLRSLRRAFDHRFQLIDSTHREHIVRTLVAKGFPADVVRDTVTDDSGCGNGFNLLRLAARGDCALVLSDRCPCQPLASWPTDGPLVLSEGEPHDAAFIYASASSTAPDTSQIGVFEPFERVLGRSLSSLSRDGAGVTADRICTHSLRAFLGGVGTVAIVGVGRASRVTLEAFHSAWTTTAGPRRPRLVSDLIRALRRRRSDAALVTAPRRYTISHHPSASFGPATALDARLLLPPFLALDTDGHELFRALLADCVPDAFGAHTPYALPDDAPETPTAKDDRQGHLTFSRLAGACLRAAPRHFEHADAPSRIRHAGDVLTRCGELRSEDLEDQLRLTVARASAIEMEEWTTLTGALARCEPDSAKRVGVWLDARREVLRQSNYIVAREMAGHLDMQAARTATQQMLHRTGRLLQWWPELVGASAECGSVEPPEVA